jgi:ubiquinone/menaquinone biosynthesis C-methylase UbiE
MSEWSKKRRVMRHYDRIAKIYERQYAEEQEAKINAVLPYVRLNEKSSILDVGCGTGILFPSVAAKARSLIGIDISIRLLQKAKQYTKEISNAHIIVADSDYLPFQDNVFNLVFAITLLQNMPNPLATLEEMKRTSQSQAIIAVTALKKEFSEEEFARLLVNTQLEILTIKTDEKIKDYAAICRLTK